MVSSKELLRRLLDDEKLKYCQDCGSCTASCPMARALPEIYNPRNILHRVYLDLDNLILREDLWLCAWCYRCTERCPQGIQPTEIFLLTRNFVAERGYVPSNPKAIIRQIIRSGRSTPPLDIDEWREEYGLPPMGRRSQKKLLMNRRKLWVRSFSGG